MSDETTLKPCPFCGGEVKLTTYRDEGWEIKCENHDWPKATWERPLKDSDIAADIDMCSWGLGEDAKAALVAAWNARAERTCRNIAEPDEMSDKSFTCSECGARGPYGEGTYHIGGCDEVDGKVVFWDSWPVYKFCPNCGAKVVGE